MYKLSRPERVSRSNKYNLVGVGLRCDYDARRRMTMRPSECAENIASTSNWSEGS